MNSPGKSEGGGAEFLFSQALSFETGTNGHHEDDVEAYALHTLAAADGHREALRHLGMLEGVLSVDTLARAKARACQLHRDLHANMVDRKA